MDPGRTSLRLYVTGRTPRSQQAETALRRLCEERLRAGFEIEVVDVLEDPARAEADRVIATPTLLRLHPTPERRIIGDLRDTETVALGLELPAVPEEEPTG